MTKLSNITISPVLFKQIKSKIDGLVFWREEGDGIEIKFIQQYTKYINPNILKQLTKL